MGRVLSERLFQITPEISVNCRSENTSYGFRHLATVYKNGRVIGNAKVSYYNRTWERYEFQAVMNKAIENADLTPKEKEYAKRWIAGDKTDWSRFQMTSTIAKLGDIMTKNKKESNIWKKRMIKAGLGGQGLDFPSDWDKLPEATKSARLDKVIGVLESKGKPDKERKKLEKKIKKMAGL